MPLKSASASMPGPKQSSSRGFPKIRGTLMGVPIIRIIVFWGLYWGGLLYRDNGKENRNYHSIMGLYTGVILGLYRDNGNKMETTIRAVQGVWGLDF